MVCSPCSLHHGKIGHELCVLVMAGEFKSKGMAVNALWPKTSTATSAVKSLLGGNELMRRSRKLSIVGDAAYRVFTKQASKLTGQF